MIPRTIANQKDIIPNEAERLQRADHSYKAHSLDTATKQRGGGNLQERTAYMPSLRQTGNTYYFPQNVIDISRPISFTTLLCEGITAVRPSQFLTIELLR